MLTVVNIRKSIKSWARVLEHQEISDRGKKRYLTTPRWSGFANQSSLISKKDGEFTGWNSWEKWKNRGWNIFLALPSQAHKYARYSWIQRQGIYPGAKIWQSKFSLPMRGVVVDRDIYWPAQEKHGGMTKSFVLEGSSGAKCVRGKNLSQ
jgi:hypothetical protein